jgi:hypothetical protein
LDAIISTRSAATNVTKLNIFFWRQESLFIFKDWMTEEEFVEYSENDGIRLGEKRFIQKNWLLLNRDRPSSSVGNTE